MVCEMRRAHPRWGARRIAYEIERTGTAPAPSRATVHRVLTRNGFVRAEEQQHRRKYKRWQREAPMHLWQLDLVGGIYLADGRECKMLTGIDEHSRFVVIAEVLAAPSGRAVADAFVRAMRVHGVPAEVLTDNGKQFTGRFTRPRPVEVLFERVCRENGIGAKLRARARPTASPAGPDRGRIPVRPVARRRVAPAAGRRVTLFLELDEALVLVTRMGFHAQDAGLLGSALARPATTVMGQPAYPTLPLQAAALLESAARNHPLIDGNKRTAWVLTVVFLAMNGAEHDLGPDQVFDLVVGVAEGSIGLEQSTQPLSAHLRPAAS